MINIGPAALWEGVIFGLLIIGAIAGMFTKTLGGVYFFGSNLVLIGILYLLAPVIIPSLAKAFDGTLKGLFSASPQFASTSIILSNVVATVTLYLGWFIFTNLILLAVYVPVLRKIFRVVKINRPINYLIGAIFGFLTMMILGYYLTNLTTSKVFYTKNGFSQDIEQMLESTTNESATYSNKMIKGGADNLYGWLPQWQVKKTGNSLAYLFWIGIVAKNSPGSVADLIDQISDSSDFADNISDMLEGLSPEDKNDIIDNILEPIVGDIVENIENGNLPDAKIQWTDINNAVQTWMRVNPGQNFSGVAVNEMMASNPDDNTNPYQYFAQLKKLGDETDDSVAFSAIFKDGNKLYNTLKNIYTIGKLVPNATTVQTFNTLIEKYVIGMVIIDPGKDDPRHENYNQISTWF